MADEIKTPDPVPEIPDTDALGLPTKVDHAIRWGMVILGIVLSSLGAMYPDPSSTDAYPQWVRAVLVVGGIVMTTFKGLGFNVMDLVKSKK